MMNKVSQMMTTPRLLLSVEVAQKIAAYINSTKGEVSGLGVVSRSGVDFMVEEVYLLRQVCTPGSTVMDEEAIADLLFSFSKNGHDPSTIRLWWHSHYNGPVFWSGTDNDTINGLASNWMVSLVSNTSGDYLARFDLFDPLRFTFTIEVQVVFTKDQDIIDAAKEEVQELVSYPTFAGFIRKPVSLSNILGGNEDG